MVIDFNYFGYGAGLVMVGWACGQVYSLVVHGIFGAVRRG